jgi:hypothetical protein
LPSLFLASTYALVLSKIFFLVRQSSFDILFQAIYCLKQNFLLRILDFAVYAYAKFKRIPQIIVNGELAFSHAKILGVKHFFTFIPLG